MPRLETTDEELLLAYKMWCKQGDEFLVEMGILNNPPLEHIDTFEGFKKRVNTTGTEEGNFMSGWMSKVRQIKESQTVHGLDVICQKCDHENKCSGCMVTPDSNATNFKQVGS